MKDDIVLSYEMHKPGILGFPPFFPTLRQKLLSIGYISYRSVEPYVEHFSFSPFDWHRDAPVEVAADGTRLEPAVNPGLALPVNIGSPFLMTVENPFLQPRFIPVEREIPMLCLFLYRRAPAQGRMRIQKFVRTEGASAFFALVAISPFVTAFRAGAYYISVRKECIGFSIEILLAFFLDEFPFVIHLAEEI